MNTYLVDYHFLDQRGNREDEHDYHTVEIEADNDDIPTIKSGVEKHLYEKETGYWDIEIRSISWSDD
tara:strand:- start:311 stop:511 length:201 start_codon:yes stop_codon:yes gene_type:complete